MSCEDTVCGTGNWTGPKPGDPDNNVTLSATTVFGGVEVSWSYPATYPHAVAHTLLYRGTSSDFGLAIQRGVVAGSHFYDQLEMEHGLQYYYWINLVSVNGTVGALIGPAVATASSLVSQIIEQLTAKIDSGVLALALKEKIDNITNIDEALKTENLERRSAFLALQEALANVLSDNGEAQTYILNSITESKTKELAMIDALNVLAVGLGDAAAALVEEAILRATLEDVTASKIDLLYATYEGMAGAILEESKVYIDQYGVSAEQLTLVQAAIGDDIASVELNLQTNIDLNGEKTTKIGALYTAKVSVNGLIGGFGVYNDGSTVEAGFDVDTFWVGRTGANKKKPFIITDGIVYIDSAFISKLTADQIDTRNLTIKDAEGKVLFGGGTGLGVDSIFGIGTLASMSSVSSGDVMGLGPFATKTTIQSNEVSGLGTLATENTVKLGSNVTFPDGSVINSVDLVSRLSKINKNTISTFMDGAAITNAYIGNAEVNTLKIAGEAVTIPRYIYSATLADVSLSITLPETSSVFILASVNVPNSHFDQYLYVDGAVVRTEGMIGGSIPGIVYSTTLSAGTHVIRIQNTDSAGVKAGIYALVTRR